jgi:hypothetical protein
MQAYPGTIEVSWGSHDNEQALTYWRAEEEERVILLSPKKLAITRVVHDSLYTLLKSKHVAAYLLHARIICDADMAGIVNEKVIHEEPDSMEDESAELA